MSSRSMSSRAFEALGRVTWKLVRRKAEETVNEHRPGRAKSTRRTGLRKPGPTEHQQR